ncbi:AAA+ ATPase domain-containing protein [Pleurotus pulmonarius]
MPPADPSWRVKSQPCPFYQQGKCFFQENCNFLHDIQTNGNRTAVADGVDATLRRRRSPPPAPTVQIHSPTLSVRSSRRSPRMSGLLLALKDVIGDVEDDEEEDDDDPIREATEYLSQPLPDTSNASITLVHMPPTKSKSTSPDQSPISAEQSIEHTSFRATPDLLSPVGSEVSNLPSVPFPLRIPSRTFRRDDSIDSGYADSWHSPRPLVRSPPRSPALSSTFDILVSPFGTPSARVRGSTPVPVSPLTLSFDEGASAPPSPNSDDVDSDVGSPPRFMDDDDDDEDVDFMHDNSLTSRPIAIKLGGPDTLSPPRTLVAVDGELLSQGTGERGSPELDPLSAAERSWDLSENNATAIFSPTTSPINEEALNIRQSLNVQNPTQWLNAGSTSFNQDDISLNSSPLLIPIPDVISEHREISPLTPDLIPPHSAVSSESSSASECVTADFLDDEDQTGSSSIFSPTARLAYMTSPDTAISSASGSADDTLYSLYDVYTADSPKGSPTPSIPSPLSDSEGSIFNSYTDMEPVAPVGSPASTISRKSRSTDKTPTKASFGLQRERVFTPPVPSSSITRGRSGTVVLSPTIAQTETPPMPSPPSPTESIGEATFASPPSPFHPFIRQSVTSVMAPRYIPSRHTSLRLTGSQHPSPRESIRGTASLIEQDSFFSSPVQVEERLHEPFTGRRSSRESIERLDAAEDATISWAADQRCAEASTDVYTHSEANASTSRKNSVSSGHSEGSNPPSSRRESLPATSAAESSAGRNRRSFLKPLRLSTISNLSSSISRSSYIASASSVTPSSPSMHTLSSAPPIYRASKRSSVVSASASASVSSFPRNSLISTKRISYIPSSTANTISAQQHDDFNDTTSPMERNDNRRSSTYDLNYRRQSILSSHSRTNGRARSIQSKDLASHIRSSSIFSEPTGLYDLDEDPTITEDGVLEYQDSQDEQICRPLQTPNTAPPTRPPSIMDSPHAIGTPSPNLIFAIASDDVDQVRQALTHGDTNPNERLGPQSALAFTVTNDALENKLSIVKTLLAHGADPRGLEQEVQKTGSRRGSKDESYDSSESTAASTETGGLEQLDPATRYYIKRAGAAHTRQTSALIYRSFFRPLTKVRYEMQLSVAPIVVLLCGPSGHGKSLLARRFGSLLDVPTHTVNMTTVRSTLDLWRSYSLSPYEEPSDSTLAEFLVENEGKRCVVVLDEIEKTEDPKTLHSLLMPWELGRCSFEAGSRHVDVRNVIWLGTSNVGQELVFDHHATRAEPETLMSREEYVQLMALLRPRVSDQLGTSILSRVTTVLPFVTFTTDEKMAIASEALHTLAERGWGDAI